MTWTGDKKTLAARSRRRRPFTYVYVFVSRLLAFEINHLRLKSTLL
jgi:hypothetical protein